MTQLYENIKNRRIELGLSQQELAEAVGYKGKSMIAHIESGDIDISVSTLFKFAKVLKCSTSFLLSDESLASREANTPRADLEDNGILTIGERIAARRTELGFTQEELAKRMGYSTKTSISRAENAGNDIGLNRVVKFAEALDCSSSFLMGWDNNPSPNISNEKLRVIIEKLATLSDPQVDLVTALLEQMK